MPSSLVQIIRRYLPLRYDKWGRGSPENSSEDNDGKKVHDPEKANEPEKVHEPRRPEPKKPNQRPPELDKLWKDFTDKLNRAFKRKKSYAGGGGPDDDHPRRGVVGVDRGWFSLVFVFLTIVTLWMASGFFIVQEGQTGVVMTFGRFSHMTSSGVNWRWPYPVQGHEVVNVSQVRTIEVGYRSNLRNKQPREALMLTHDENIIEIQFAMQYTLKSASDWVFNNRNQEDMVRQVAETSIREVVGKSNMDFVLYEGRDKIAMDVHKLMQGIFDQYQAGIQITNVTMQGVQPPEQVQAAFDDAVKASQDRERQKNEGQAYANDVIPRARGAASRLLQEAEGYRGRVSANAEGDVARFKQVLVEYQKAPAVTRDRMYLDTMQQIFANTSKLMMDAKGGSNLLYLPLDKLMAQTAAQNGASASSAVQATPASAAPTAAAPVPAQAPAAPAPRARETREREGR